MLAINSKSTLPHKRPKSIDFGLLLHHQITKASSHPRQKSNSFNKDSSVFVEITGKRLERIEDLQNMERQFRYSAKAQNDHEHSKRFSKLQSIKRSKTLGNQRQASEDKNKVLIISIPQKNEQACLKEQNHQEHGKKVRHHQQDSRNKIKMVDKPIDFYDINEEIQDLTQRLNSLISQKLSKLSGLLRFTKKTDKLRFDNPLRESDFYNDLKDLIRRIKQLKSNNKDNDEQIKLLNKKIECIQSLIAENVTESELIKKYYLCFNFNRSRNTIGRFMSMGPRVFKTYHERSLHKKQQEYSGTDKALNKGVFFGQSTNKESFQPPRKEFYNNDKYQQQAYAFNDQPLPRSSYRRQFLNMKTLPFEKMRRKEEDSYQLPKYTTTMKSRYNLDYHYPKPVTNVNFKELDSYQDKLKFIEVSYSPNRQQSLEQSINRLQLKDGSQIMDNKMIKEQLSKLPSKSKVEAIFDKNRFATENQKSYGVFFGNERSRIKHQQLKEFQYRLKNIYKS